MKKKSEPGTDPKAAAKGRRTAIPEIKEGQKKGLQEFEEALLDAALSSEVKRLIRSRLLPKSKADLAAHKRPLQKSER